MTDQARPHRLTGYTAEQFARDYAARDGRPLASILERRHVVPCGGGEWPCDDPQCQGWAMVLREFPNKIGLPEFGNTVAYPPPREESREVGS